MNFLQLVDFLIHVDKYVIFFVQQYGLWVYLILFLIVAVETGIVIMPFLPGDSLIFIAGTFAAAGVLNIFLVFAVFALAAIVGDTMNYWIGEFLGNKIIMNRNLIKPEYLERTKQFYEKHGGKTIILARFVPIIRTFAPFVACIGKMNYIKFLSYNVIGAILWVAVFSAAGYFLGGFAIVKNNLTLFAIGIVILSIMPAVIEFIRHRK